MNMKQYKVTCHLCKGSNVVTITEHVQGFEKHYAIDLNTDHRKNDPKIISARYRGDGEFGWQCICGNTSIVAKNEFPGIDSLMEQGSKKAVQHIANSLILEDDEKFAMELL